MNSTTVNCREIGTFGKRETKKIALTVSKIGKIGGERELTTNTSAKYLSRSILQPEFHKLPFA